MQKITPFLWFDHEAEEAAELYTSLLPDGRIVDIVRYGDVGPGEPGKVMTVAFELGGQRFTALNGGDQGFKFDESVSFVISCESQEEVDRLWAALTADGGEESQCGWLKDRYGLSWQIVPSRLMELLSDPDRERAQRAMQAMLQMRKIVIDEVEQAAA